MNRLILALSLFSLLSKFAAAQEVSLVYPGFDRYEIFRDAYVAPEGRGFAVGGCGILYRTTDNGSNWAEATRADDRAVPNHIQCAPGTNCEVAYLMTNRGVFRTADGGDEWTSVSSDRFSQFDFSVPGTIFAYFPGGTLLQKSEDDGLTWERIPSVPRIQDKVQIVSSTNFAVISDSSFYRSTDGGASWEEMINFGKRVALITTDDDGNHYVELQGADIYKSSNGGMSWELKTENAHQYSLYYDLYKDAEDSLHVISFNGVRFSSGDDGVTWSSVTRHPFQRYNSHRRGEGRMTMAGDGLTILTGNADVTEMETLITERFIEFRDINFYDANTGYAFGEQGEVVRTTDGGNSWEMVSQIGDWMSGRPKVAADGSLYGAIGISNLGRSTNQGESWDELTSANAVLGGGRRVFDVLPNGEFVAMTNQRTIRLDAQNNILFSADGGHPSTSGGTFDLKMINQDLGFIIRWARLEIYRTQDGGVTWDTIPSFGGNNFFSWFEVEDENTFVIGNGAGNWRTTDAGLNWEELDFQTALGRFSIGDDRYGFHRQTLYRDRNDGAGWLEQFSTCNQPLDMVRRPGTNEIFLIYQNGIERLDIDEILSPVFQTPQRVSGLKAWPNPNGGTLFVGVPDLGSQLGGVSIFDLRGRRFDVQASRNNGTLQLDLQPLPAGCYLLRYVTAAGEIYQTKIVRQ